MRNVKRPKFTKGMEVAVYVGGYVATITTVREVSQNAVHTEWHRNGNYNSNDWTITGRQPRSSRGVREYILPATQEAKDTVTTRTLRQSMSRIDWSKVELNDLIQISLCVPKGAFR